MPQVDDEGHLQLAVEWHPFPCPKPACQIASVKCSCAWKEGRKEASKNGKEKEQTKARKSFAYHDMKLSASRSATVIMAMMILEKESGRHGMCQIIVTKLLRSGMILQIIITKLLRSGMILQIIITKLLRSGMILDFFALLWWDCITLNPMSASISIQNRLILPNGWPSKLSGKIG
jgi:hypothetical protein